MDTGQGLQCASTRSGCELLSACLTLRMHPVVGGAPPWPSTLPLGMHTLCCLHRVDARSA
jgi:hypothetical protein